MPLFQAAAIGLLALIITPGYFFYFDVTPKLVVLLLAAAVSLGEVATRHFRPPRVFSLLLALSLCSLAVSTVLSPRPALSLFGSNWRRYGSATQAAVLLFAWIVIARGPHIVTVLRAVAAAGALTAIYGIAQYFGWDPLLPAAAYHIGEGVWTIVRPPSTLGYVSYFATWLLFVIFLSLALAAQESGVMARRLAQCCAALSTCAMVLTGTRAALLGAAAGAAVWLCFRGLHTGSHIGWHINQRVLTAGLTVILAVLLAGAAFYYSPPGGQLRSRARWFVEDPWGGARPKLWRDSLLMGVASPLAGYGPETFTAEFPRWESADLAQAYPDFAHESPHNIFLDALVAQGAPGLLLLAGFCAAGFAAAWRLRAKHRNTAACLAAALAAGIVSQQFTVFTIPTAVIFYTTIALAIGLARESLPTQNERHNSTRSRVPLAIAGSAAALALLYLAVRFAIADHSLGLAKRSLESGDVPAAAARYAKYDRERLPGTASDLWYSRALLASGQLRALGDASAAGLRATQTAEDPFNAWYNLSVLDATRNDIAGAERSLRSAIAANPTWFKPHWMLAQVLRLDSRLAEAEREAAVAVHLNAGRNPEVARTLQEIRAGLQK